MKLSLAPTLCALISGSLFSQESPSLWSPSAQAPDPGIPLPPDTIQSQVVDIDMSLLREGQVFLLDDLEVSLGRPEPAYGGGWVATGARQEDPEAEIVFAWNKEFLAASFRSVDQHYQLAWAGNGVHRWIQLPLNSGPACGTTFEHAVTNHAPTSAPGGTVRHHETIDVMVVFTTAALNGHGGSASSMNNAINLGVVQTNNTFRNSGVNQRITLVHTAEMAGYTEKSGSSGFSAMLSDLTNGSGALGAAHTLRDEYGADFVTMLVANSAYGGVAWLMTNVSPSFERWAFNLVTQFSVNRDYVLAHELGHNMGCAHDRQNAGGSGAYSYSYGYRTSGNPSYRTVMAYAPGIRLGRWSGPNVIYNGQSLGRANKEENVRTLNNTHSTCENFRDKYPILMVPTLLANFPANIEVSNATQGDQIIMGLSLTGAGPTSTPVGTALLTPPIYTSPFLSADSGGEVALTWDVPKSLKGLQVWFHAANISTGRFTNAENRTVL